MRIARFLLPVALSTGFAALALDASTCHQVAKREAELHALLQSWHVDFLSTMTGESLPVLVPPTDVVEAKAVFADEQIFRVGSMLGADSLHGQITQLLHGDLVRTDADYAKVIERLAVTPNEESAAALRLLRERAVLAAREECRSQNSQK